MSTLPIAFRVVLTILVVTGGISDVRFRRIPNWLTVSGVALGLGLNAGWARQAGLLESLEGIGLALLIYVPLYLLRGMGAGDVKLMGAVGAIAGPANWLLIFLATCILGGVAALAMVASRKRVRQTWFNVRVLLGSLARFEAPYRSNAALDVRDAQSARLPHGAVIACGAMLCIVLESFTG